MTNKTYDVLKLIALLVAPIAVFITALMNTWGIPYAAEISASLAALDTLLGAIVAILKANYDKRGE